jgi:uncharacterized RDD family membrane protein YckC
MSSMPQSGEPGQPGGQGAGPGERTGLGTQHGAMPGQHDSGSAPAGGIPGQQGAMAGQQSASRQQRGQPQWSDRPGSMSPVDRAETRVTGRRIVQYWIDMFLVSIVPELVSIPFDRTSSTFLHIMGGIVYVVLFVVIGLWYWVIRPHSHNGQTFAMKWFGVRVISKDGGPANMAQLLVRWVGLIFDAFPWIWPFTGLLGWIVILCSRYRQRIGDHLARTLVVATGPGVRTRPAYAGAGGGQVSMDSSSNTSAYAPTQAGEVITNEPEPEPGPGAQRGDMPQGMPRDEGR